MYKDKYIILCTIIFTQKSLQVYVNTFSIQNLRFP